MVIGDNREGRHSNQDGRRCRRRYGISVKRSDCCPASADLAS